MATKRKPTVPTTEAIDWFCAAFDDLVARYEGRTALRQYLIGRLLPREHTKRLVELGAIVPGANRQALHHFMHDAPSRCGSAQPPPTGALASPCVSGSTCGWGAHRG